DQRESDDSYIDKYRICWIQAKFTICRNVLIVISYPFRFTIYCGMSQQFRDVVKQMFTGKVLREAHDGENSTSMALAQTTTEKDSGEKQ
ncbi:hypothetical protein OSTOST_00087, partial [Ostertagia ostertagi]